MEVQTQWGTVLFVVTVKVVVKEVVELISSQNVRARVDHSTAWKIFVVVGVFTTVKFVHYHFPHSVAPSGATL